MNEAAGKAFASAFVTNYFENVLSSFPKVEHSPTLDKDEKGAYTDNITSMLMTFFIEGGRCALEFQEFMAISGISIKPETVQ